MANERKLPTYTIAGTEFIVDVQQELLLQADIPYNTIHFHEMDYRTSHYYFHYDTSLKNLSKSAGGAYEIVRLPNMTELDPLGMAQKYGMEPSQITGKTDVEVVNDPEQIKMRESGRQPVIEIAGHPFFVDIHWGLLRPKDDFSTLGIPLNDLDSYLSDYGKSYQIPYDPKTHTFKEPDYSTLTSIPKDLIVVEFPSQQILDPIGYARKYELDKNAVLRKSPLQMQMKARTVPWEETSIRQVIASNLKTRTKEKAQRKKGRRI